MARKPAKRNGTKIGSAARMPATTTITNAATVNSNRAAGGWEENVCIRFYGIGGFLVKSALTYRTLVPLLSLLLKHRDRPFSSPALIAMASLPAGFFPKRSSHVHSWRRNAVCSSHLTVLSLLVSRSGVDSPTSPSHCARALTDCASCRATSTHSHRPVPPGA